MAVELSMGDYDLSGLSSTSFEELLQALAVKVLGAGADVFGDGPDGGREATFEGRMDYPSQADPWDGYCVVQAKFRRRPEGTGKDGEWALAQLEKELKHFAEPKKRRRAPEYYIFATNVVLSPVQGKGAKDKVADLFRKYEKKVPVRGWTVWDFDKIGAFLDDAADIRHAYGAWVTPGDVFAAMLDGLKPERPDFLEVIAPLPVEPPLELPPKKPRRNQSTREISHTTDLDIFQQIESSDGMMMKIWRPIPEGHFWMGEDRDSGQHKVRILSPFRLAAIPITNEQFKEFSPNLEFGKDLACHPVVEVTWHQAMEFCAWLDREFTWAKGARLPTEEEWEYACRAEANPRRAEANTRFYNGDTFADLHKVGWYLGNSLRGKVQAVAKLEANQWNLYDMHGNVSEWTLSSRRDYSGRERGCVWDPSKVDVEKEAMRNVARRVARGGCATYSLDNVTSSSRELLEPTRSLATLGFRVLLPPDRSQ